MASTQTQHGVQGGGDPRVPEARRVDRGGGAGAQPERQHTAQVGDRCRAADTAATPLDTSSLSAATPGRLCGQHMLSRQDGFVN